MRVFVGKRNQRYQLAERPLGYGGEGAVYAINNDPNRVAKLYHANKLAPESARRELQEKLETMLGMNIASRVDGILKIAWVEDILFENGRFVGFVMPKVTAPYKIYDIARNSEERRNIFGEFNWKCSVQIAYNLSWIVYYLHMNNIVVGDMNMNNIAVGTQGEVVLIDCDSFDIRNAKTNKHYKCTVGLPELLAPEIQAYNLVANAEFTQESDDFSLAIHIFRLLMENADPFNAKVLASNTDSQSAINANLNIINGECPHFRTVPGKAIPPKVLGLDFLPRDIADAFRNTFTYDQKTAVARSSKRTTAKQWNQILLKYAAPYPNSTLKTCKKNAAHVYPAHLFTCPFCKHEKKVKKIERKEAINRQRLYN